MMWGKHSGIARMNARRVLVRVCSDRRTCTWNFDLLAQEENAHKDVVIVDLQQQLGATHIHIIISMHIHPFGIRHVDSVVSCFHFMLAACLVMASSRRLPLHISYNGLLGKVHSSLRIP
jgi:hypothetical protein